jgi:glycosyltransferase involved in cell wall biosynthesis
MNIFPKISIVTTSYNDGEYIRETLDSIHSQGYPNLEHIIVDGGSTDDSIQIIKQYESSIAWWCSEPDNGHGEALAKGFAKVSGDILGWVCSDDVLLPGSLAKIAEHYRKNPNCRWLSGDGLMIDEKSAVIDKVFTVELSHHRFLHWQFWGAVQPSIFFSRKAYDEAGGVDGQLNLSPDFDICLRIARKGKSEILRHPIGALRMHANTQTRKHQKEMIKINQALRSREGFRSDRFLINRFLYFYYNQTFLMFQRWKKMATKISELY